VSDFIHLFFSKAVYVYICLNNWIDSCRSGSFC